MGPRSFERGNRVRKDRDEPAWITLQWGRAHSSAEIHGMWAIPPSCSSFNGAALIRARKFLSTHRAPLPLARFNGAALIRARKSCDPATLIHGGIVLQWGRAHS